MRKMDRVSVDIMNNGGGHCVNVFTVRMSDINAAQCANYGQPYPLVAHVAKHIGQGGVRPVVLD